MTADAFEPFLREIGRLVVNFNSADHQLRRIACLLMDERDERPGWIILDALGVARVEELVRALTKYRVADVELAQRVVDATDDIARNREKRNSYVHAFWRVPNSATDLTGLQAAQPPRRKEPDYRVLPDSHNSEIIRQAATHAYDASNNLERVHTALKKYLESR
jgi:hypothetical protein